MEALFPNLRHLRAFKEVAERGSVSAAADAVHLSQPAVTQAIAGLEKRFEARLFDRRSEGMFPTELGGILLLRVQRIFECLEHGAALALQSAGQRQPSSQFSFINSISASQLRALVAIWETRSFSLAARRAGIAQPSMHRAGRDLEKQAGVPFFVATRRGIEPTEAADHFARGVKLAAVELKQGYDEIAAALGRDSTRIAIGSMPLSRTSILPQSIHDLLCAHDGVQVQTVEGPYEELLRSLRYGDLDFLIGALRTPVPADDVLQEFLFNDPLAIVASASHPLAGRKNLRLEDTFGYPWLAPPINTPSGAYLHRTIGIDTFDETPVRIVSSSLVLVRGLLMRGNYVTIMSRHQMAVEYQQGIMVPLDIDLPESNRPIGITHRAAWRPTATQSQFLSLVRSASAVGT